MGHAGAIVDGIAGNAHEKIAAFEKAAVKTANNPEEIPGLLLR